MLDDKIRFQQDYAQLAASVDQNLEKYLDQDGQVPELLIDAMRYSLRAGGKRLRPVMALMACQACGGQVDDAIQAAVALEMVHTYSLIHDDLPAMDNDDFRRGKPTNHKVFGEGIAILAGDALLTRAFHLLADCVENAEISRRLISELARGAGNAGMIAGQVADLKGEQLEGDIDMVDYIHTRKTAMMFAAAMRMGAICAGCKNDWIDRLGHFGLKLGLAFQIVDDLLDVTSTAEQLGKQTQKDAQAGKLTYPSMIGVEASRIRADELMSEAGSLLAPLGPAGLPLKFLAEMLVNRDK